MMPQHWVIEVLTDLQGFARRNDMPVLAQHLDQTLAVAAQELARRGGDPTRDIESDGPSRPGWHGL